MKAIIVLIVLLIVAGCTTNVVDNNTTNNITNTEQLPPVISRNESSVPRANEVPPSYSPENNIPPSFNEVSVLNPGFEEESENFVALENPLKVGFQYSKYYLSPFEGKATMRVIVAQAKKEAFEVPAFRVTLNGLVKAGQDYKVTMYFDNIKGSWYPMKVGFGGEKFSQYTSEEATKEYTKVTFDVTADVDSNYLYLYFDGTKTKEFKIDSISIN